MIVLYLLQQILFLANNILKIIVKHKYYYSYNTIINTNTISKKYLEISNFELFRDILRSL